MCTKSETEFSVNLLKQLYSEDKSIVYSPISIFNVLSVIFAGCNGITSDELSQVLGKGVAKDAIVEYYSAVMRYCKNLNEEFRDGAVFQLLFSNAMFLSDKVSLLPEFQEEIQKFDTQLQKLNFKDTKSTAEAINHFVSKTTCAKINNIVAEADIESDASLYLVNALYFLGKWETPFEEVYPSTFYENPNSKRKIQMLSHNIINEKWNFNEGETWSCLGIPYENRKTWLHIILPKKKFGLSDLMKEMSGDLFKKCIEKQDSSEINVRIPVFQVENKRNLNESLEHLGLTQIFDGHGILNMFCQKHVVDKVIHSAKIEVNEFGTTASAATEAELVFSISEPIIKKRTFFASHPFIYFVTLGEKNVSDLKSVLMMGTYC